jgi:hypothetical protein
MTVAQAGDGCLDRSVRGVSLMGHLRLCLAVGYAAGQTQLADAYRRTARRVPCLPLGGDPVIDVLVVLLKIGALERILDHGIDAAASSGKAAAV